MTKKTDMPSDAQAMVLRELARGPHDYWNHVTSPIALMRRGWATAQSVGEHMTTYEITDDGAAALNRYWQKYGEPFR